MNWSAIPTAVRHQPFPHMSNLNDSLGHCAHQEGKRRRQTMLNGRPVLIVEEEFLIALDLQRMLEGLGCGQTLFARNPGEAELLRPHWPDLALAVVEQRLDDPGTRSLPESLAEAGVALVLTTGDLSLSNAARTAPLLIKPVPEEALTSAVRQALAARS